MHSEKAHHKYSSACVFLAEKDRKTAEEVERDTRTPGDVARMMERRRDGLIFRLWDADGDGLVPRKALTDALSWCGARPTAAS
jgi:hypothetical protein